MSKSLSDLAAQRLRAVMAEEGTNAAELARLMKVSHTFVWRRAKGEVSLSMGEIDRIAEALGVPANRLLPQLAAVA